MTSICGFADLFRNNPTEFKACGCWRDPVFGYGSFCKRHECQMFPRCHDCGQHIACSRERGHAGQCEPQGHREKAARFCHGR